METLKKISRHLTQQANNSDSATALRGVISNKHHVDSVKPSRKKKRRSSTKRSMRKKGTKKKGVGVEADNLGCASGTLTAQEFEKQDAVVVQDGEWKVVTDGWKTTTKLAVEFTRGSVRSSKRSLDSAYGSMRRRSKKNNRKARREAAKKAAKEAELIATFEGLSVGISSQRNISGADEGTNDDFSDFQDDDEIPEIGEDLISVSTKNKSGWKTTTKLAVGFTRGNGRSSRTSLDSAIGSLREKHLSKRPTLLKPQDYSQKEETQVRKQDAQGVNMILGATGDRRGQSSNADEVERNEEEVAHTADAIQDSCATSDGTISQNAQKESEKNVSKELSSLVNPHVGQQRPVTCDDLTPSDLDDDVDNEVYQVHAKSVLKEKLKEKMKVFKRSSSRGLHRSKLKSQSSDEDVNSSTESLNSHKAGFGRNSLERELKVCSPREDSIDEEDSPTSGEPEGIAEVKASLATIGCVEGHEKNGNIEDCSKKHADVEHCSSEDINVVEPKDSAEIDACQIDLKANEAMSRDLSNVDGHLGANNSHSKQDEKYKSSLKSLEHSVQERIPSEGLGLLPAADEGVAHKYVTAGQSDLETFTEGTTSTKQETVPFHEVADLGQKWTDALQKEQPVICPKCSAPLPQTRTTPKIPPQISCNKILFQKLKSTSTKNVPRYTLYKNLRQRGSTQEKKTKHRKCKDKLRPKKVLHSSITLETISTERFEMSAKHNMAAGISFKTGHSKVLRRMSSRKLSLVNNYSTLTNSAQHINNNAKENSMPKILSTKDCSNAILRQLVAVNADMHKELVEVKKRVKKLEEHRCSSPYHDA